MAAASSWYPVVRAQTSTPLWRMNITAGAAPHFGWGIFDPSNREGIQWRTSFVAGGGPGGRDAAQVQMIPLASGGFGANIWEGAGSARPSQGGVRYIRYYIYYSNVTHLRRAQDGDFWGVKTVLINANPDTERAIETSAPHTAAENLQIRFGKNINGPPDETIGDPLLRVGWNAVQLGIFTSSTTTSRNGGYRVWLNNDQYSSPSASSSFTTSHTASALGDLSLLAAMEPLRNSTTLTIRFAAFEYDDEFDAGWSARMGSGDGGGGGGGTTVPTAPAAPLNLRLIQ
jgi:hypothetical protein